MARLYVVIDLVGTFNCPAFLNTDLQQPNDVVVDIAAAMMLLLKDLWSGV
jgi:hypothetical protein